MDNLGPARKLAIISHMNEDHSDACLLYARHFARNHQAKSAEDFRTALVEMVKLAKRN